MSNSFLLGMAYGIGGTAFGVAIRYIGFSLTYAIAVGLSVVLGTIIPPLLAGELGAAFHKAGGGFIFLGLGIGTAGIVVTGIAGRLKERDVNEQTSGQPALPATPGVEGSSVATAEELTRISKLAEPKFDIGRGLLLSLLANVLSAFYGFALNAGQPIADVAVRHGAGVFQGNLVYIFANSGTFLTTLLYCGFLHFRQGSFGEFLTRPKGEASSALLLNFLLAGLTGVLWYGQFFSTTSATCAWAITSSAVGPCT